MSPRRVVVCGTNFGRFHVDAIRRRPHDYELAAIVAKGSAASRAYADRLGVPFHTDVDTLPDDIDLGCVAVGSAISGSVGTELAQALLRRGVHVLQEHPLHLAEFTQCLRVARASGVQYHVNTHYRHVEPVARFLAAARRLRQRQDPLFVDAATPVHLLHPLVDILGAALGAVRPWHIGDPAPALPGHPFRSVHATIAGVPLTLRVHHQLDPADRDNHALLWHRVAIGTEGGVLTLADTHGPVLWHPRLHADRDARHRFVLDGPDTGHLDLPTASAIGAPSEGTFRDVFATLWPDAIAHALDGLRDAAAANADVLRSAQFDLTVCRIWSTIAERLGPPDIVRPRAPEPLAVSALEPPPRPAGAPLGTATPIAAAGPHASVGYSASAEFFDLVAAPHTASGSVPAIVAALAHVDPTHGPILDLGAGTGLVTEAIGRAYPRVEIIAAEPAVGMRAALTSRVFADEDLRRRVTVTDGAAPDLDLPETLSAAVLCGILGHLDADARATLWRRLDERLAPDAPIVVELMSLDRPTTLPELRLAHGMVGGHTYAWWCSGEPESAPEPEPRSGPGSDSGPGSESGPGSAGADRMRLFSRWTVHDGDILLREVHDTHTWFTFDLDRIARESGHTLEHLTTRPGGPPLAVLRRRPADHPLSTAPHQAVPHCVEDPT
ncbi:Gfo/Idh/MocA family oxidoreductase [Streptomyces sp. SID3343]|uniref:Gfo/Idh/MocA family oxidoreductase n=1 Tax=Streptomyces sp. SID3343 TaxID=2690260 RepID=UPI00136C8E17|nr:Gfo/Idh/MocA family oxidoreductase [Streptomyces sp. SID3343]